MAGMQAMLLGGVTNPTVTATDVSGFTPGSGFVISNTPGTTPAGGTPGYTYSWTFVSGSATPAISNASVQNPTWSATLGATTLVTAVWRVTITDAAGRTASTTINVSLETA